MRVLIAGCGDVGAALGLELTAAGHDVWGLRREPAGLPATIHPLRADLTRPATLAGLPRGIDLAVYTVAPAEATDAAYQAVYVEGLRGLLEVLAADHETPPRRVVFTSSTAVYGQTDGSWVDETSATDPRDFRGRRLLEAERTLLAGPIPATVVRLGGIYGAGRTRLVVTPSVHATSFSAWAGAGAALPSASGAGAASRTRRIRGRSRGIVAKMTARSQKSSAYASS
jgi:nucleoside-diphosphate-sugar epimerase